MKAADGVQIAERYRDRHTLLKCWTEAGKHPKTEYNTFEFAQEIVRLIEDVSRAEERERVLREALTRIASDFETDYVLDGVVVDEPANTHRVAWIVARAAITAAPEQGKEAKS